MSKRLTRARHQVRDAGIPFAVPSGHRLPGRLAAVLAVVYLIFNQGWGGGRVDLAAHAIHLGRALAGLTGPCLLQAAIVTPHTSGGRNGSLALTAWPGRT